MTRLPALLTIAQGAKLANMSPKTFRKWIREREQARDEQGALRYPNLRQGSGRKWRIQKVALREALGGEAVDLEALTLETAARVDGHERRLSRLEGARVA